jgi:hypothetical protein
VRALLAWALAWLAEGVAALCVAHDRLVEPVRSRWPATRRFLKRKVFEIKGSTDDDRDTVYLVRYVVFQTDNLRLYVHRFLRSDYPVHHDHPWRASFLQLRNTYTEEVLVRHPHVDEGTQAFLRLQGRGFFKVVERRRSLLEVNTVDQSHIHRVRLDRDYHDDPLNAPLTLALCGSRRKDARGEDDWGFWVAEPVAPRGTGIPLRVRQHWKDHLRVTEDNADRKASH